MQRWPRLRILRPSMPHHVPELLAEARAPTTLRLLWTLASLYPQHYGEVAADVRERRLEHEELPMWLSAQLSHGTQDGPPKL
jgi:hypothetical protein